MLFKLESRVANVSFYFLFLSPSHYFCFISIRIRVCVGMYVCVCECIYMHVHVCIYLLKWIVEQIVNIEQQCAYGICIIDRHIHVYIVIDSLYKYNFSRRARLVCKLQILNYDCWLVYLFTFFILSSPSFSLVSIPTK